MIDCSGLENCRTERYRGFESLSLRPEPEDVSLRAFLFNITPTFTPNFDVHPKYAKSPICQYTREILLSKQDPAEEKIKKAAPTIGTAFFAFISIALNML